MQAQGLSKLDKARAIVEQCNNIRDTLLSRLHDMPEEWDCVEIRLLVRKLADDAVYHGDKYRRRTTLLNKAFLSLGLRTGKTDAPDAFAGHFVRQARRFNDGTIGTHSFVVSADTEHSDFAYGEGLEDHELIYREVVAINTPFSDWSEVIVSSLR